MCGPRFAQLTVLILAGLLSGCGSPKQELPTQEKIQQQVKRDAAMRDAEDRLDKEKAAGRNK
jgi:hypothetical protein